MSAPTPAALRAAYGRAKLWTLGITFKQALASPLLRRGLTGSAKARLRRAKTLGQLNLL